MANPLQFTDVFGRRHTEPSVTGTVIVQQEAGGQGDLVNDLVIVSPFRSGKPKYLNRYGNLAAFAAAHDPDSYGDQGVALARIAAGAFADEGVFGAASLLSVRVNPATQSEATIRNTGDTATLMTVKSGDYGAHTRNSRLSIAAGTHIGKKVTLTDGERLFVGDDLGIALSIEYTGDGSAAALTILQEFGVYSLTAQPADGDGFTLNGVVFEYGPTPAPGAVAVALGAAVTDTRANVVAAINANCPGVSATIAGSFINLSAVDDGLAYVEGTDTGSVASFTASGRAAGLKVVLTSPTDGSANLNLSLRSPALRTIAKLAAHINAQPGYEATVNRYANKFLASDSLDVATAVDIKTAAVNLTAYADAIADWINTQTRGAYVVASVTARAEPKAETSKAFTGGLTPAAVASDWEDALNEVSAKLEIGGIVLLDTDDAAIMAMANTWIEEQRAGGKWFRVYAGASPGQSVDGYTQLAASINSTRFRLAVQRCGVFADGGGITYLHPVFLAAALAGGASGNRPWVNPLTNKSLRFAAIHESDAYDLPTREQLIEAGINVVKSERGVIRLALHVTTSQDDTRRMVRVASEIDTVSTIDSDMRQAFLAFRGKWTTGAVAARSLGVMHRVLGRFVDEGALVAGVDDYNAAVPAYRFGNPPSVISAGVLRLSYQVYVGGELNHISEVGIAEYAKLVAQLGGGGVTDLSTSVPIR